MVGTMNLFAEATSVTSPQVLPPRVYQHGIEASNFALEKIMNLTTIYAIWTRHIFHILQFNPYSIKMFDVSRTPPGMRHCYFFDLHGTFLDIKLHSYWDLTQV